LDSGHQIAQFSKAQIGEYIIRGKVTNSLSAERFQRRRRMRLSGGSLHLIQQQTRQQQGRSTKIRLASGLLKGRSTRIGNRSQIHFSGCTVFRAAAKLFSGRIPMENSSKIMN
jgi:hypothetical protein